MAMTRLAGTDVWYKTVPMPRGARFSYKLAPDIPLLPGSTSPLEAASATARADPLNPRRWNEKPDASEYEYSSLAELPGATPQPWAEVRPEVKAGKVEEFKVASALLKNERTIAMYTPNGYAARGERLPLLVVFDDPVYRDLVPTPTILDNLIAAGRIPPMLAAIVGNPTYESRRTELLGSEAFIEFLVTELMPWIRARYHVTGDPGRVIIGGSSAGGFTAAFAGLRHPEVFGKILSQSGSYWWSPTRDMGPSTSLDESLEPAWLLHQFAIVPRLPLEFYLDAGWFEIGNGPGIVDTNRYLRDVLLAKGYRVHHQEFIGGHDYVNWRGTLADGLLLLIGNEREGTLESAVGNARSPAPH
jgi:enterochelin esterase family protein